MTISWDWFREGLDVGLIYGGKLVGKGTIISTDPERICHLVKLGNDHVHVLVLEVFDGNLEMDSEERLADMIGSYLMWQKCYIQPSYVIPVENEVDATLPNRVGGESENISGSNDEQGNEASFKPRSAWMGMMVKVVDMDGVTFAIATIHITNLELKVLDTKLADTHLGISLDEFMENASAKHLRLKDRVVPWPMDRLIGSDGKLLQVHNQQDQAGSAKDVLSHKRVYVHVNRKRKQPAMSLTKRQISLSQENVLLISTMTCCRNNCCQHFNRDLAMTIQQTYWDKSFELRKEYEINAICNALQLESGENIVVVEGTTICLEAWRILHSRGRSQFSELKKMVMLTDSTHGNKGKRRMSERVSQAFASMKEIIDEYADYHPAKLRTAADKSRQVVRELPTSLSWASIRNTINGINDNAGCGLVSQPTVSVLKNTHFKEVVIHKKGYNFSKCTTCSELQQRKAHLIGNKEEAAHLKADEEAHHDEHTQGRILYHTWRHQSITRPKEVLCIIHDKMDHCKTAIPRLPHCPKAIDGCLKFPITLTGILTHGHGPKAIAQYNVGVWTSDSNTMIGS